MDKESKKHNSKRPLSITIVCIFYFISISAFAFATYLLSSNLPQEYAIELNSSDYLTALISLCLLTYLIITVGLWEMKKWAAYIYLLLYAYDFATDEVNPRSLIVKGLCVYAISKNISKMS